MGNELPSTALRDDALTALRRRTQGHERPGRRYPPERVSAVGRERGCYVRGRVARGGAGLLECGARAERQPGGA